MEYRFDYSNKEELEEIINNNKHLNAIEIFDLLEEKYIVMTDEPIEFEKTWEQQVQEKISILETENENLKVEQEQQNQEILTNMLANTEIFEMVLGMTPMTLSIEEKNNKNVGGNSMIEVYATLIIKGIKTIEDVPLVIREKVVERLKQLEVPVK